MKKRVHRIVKEVLGNFIQTLVGNSSQDIFELQDTPTPEKGDFAMNSALRLTKIARKPPMVIANQMAEILAKQKSQFKQVVVAPPGFVNIFLSDDFVRQVLLEMEADWDRAIKDPDGLKTVVVDYSSVNIAKQMHVGHLRSTIIGDVIARVLEARGAKVFRQNHLGDWGLTMAMVLWKAVPELQRIESEKGDLEKELTLNKLEDLYREAGRACSQDPSLDRHCHDILVKLQNGDEDLLDAWRKITRLSMNEVYRIYDLLGVALKPEHECGESFYRNMLQETVDSIMERGKLSESQGAKCVFLDQFKAKDGSPLPVIVIKSDGGFNYETFDLAGIRYRIEKLGADRLIYVTDARQVLHFSQVFEVAKTCEWTIRNGVEVAIEHVPFGSVLGEDNKPLKTRSGENIKLADLLQEAIDRAFRVVQEKNPGLPEEKKKAVARAVGIGAVKYADLAQNRNNDYVFSWNKMLALNGNTAPYLQYAHARICSIFRKSGLKEEEIGTDLVISHDSERTLALKLVRFPEIVAAVEKELRPHILCNFLFELATTFTVFYDQCPVVNASTAEIKRSRLAICKTMRQILERGLSLLGIEAPREM